MINVEIYLSKDKLLKAVKIFGHSAYKDSSDKKVVCTAVSLLLKFFVIGLEETGTNNFEIKTPKEGEASLIFNGLNLNKEINLLINIFNKILNWIKETYKNEINIIYKELEE